MKFKVRCPKCGYEIVIESERVKEYVRHWEQLERMAKKQAQKELEVEEISRNFKRRI